MRHPYVLSIAMLITAAASSAPAAGLKVIVNNAVQVDGLSKRETSDLFLKKTPRWTNGVAVVAIDQSDRSPVREEFSKTVHGKPAAAIKSYWQQQIFSGRDVPPVEKASDSEVVAAVRANPGAVGYVDGAADTAGVKVVPIR